MAGFKGQAENSIDGKGRMPVPAKMRRSLSPAAKETFVATRGLENCVFLYPLDAWEEIETAVGQLNQFDPEARAFVRTIFRWAEELTMDSQGRIALPKPLVEFAGLQPGTKALAIGALDRIEVWDPAVFEAHLNDQTESYETLAERVMGGI
ncbi:division/cell wall cluster transcriptional repressor MraZ [Rubrivirga sp. IMCC45206]|uniref:division/cell wall cluster transcriptional repressor MraZ n=1 Tax=Rubrivirga sp. IMCC45206 TaxID=3391614 RepID=UPI00399013E8